MEAKLFKNIVEESDFTSWQILMSELDTTLNRMKYISLSELKDAYEMEQFNKFWEDVRSGETVVVSISDNADLYELSDNSVLVVLYENLEEKMIIFDSQDSHRILNKILSV